MLLYQACARLQEEQDRSSGKLNRGLEEGPMLVKGKDRDWLVGRGGGTKKKIAPTLSSGTLGLSGAYVASGLPPQEWRGSLGDLPEARRGA